jgi:thiamine-phosphate pyrophosphorylase
MNRDILRLLDANLNRAAEGMRVLEETARMLFDDRRLTGELKDLRHTLTHLFGAESGLGRGMVLARDSEHDVLREGETATERRRDDLGAVLRANARRSQEAVRSLEEYVKLVSPELSGRCKALRFRLYDIEAELTARIRIMEGAGARRLGVYVVIDRESADGLSVTDIAGSASDAGAGTVVYRDKRSCDRDFRDNAARMAEVCHERDVTFLANDRLDAALASDADGVQVGKFDLSAARCREIAGRGFVIGLSLRHGGAGEEGAEDGADFILRGTVSGDALDWDALRDAVSRSARPIVVMTGADGEGAGKILECGAAGIGIQPEKYELSRLKAEIAGLRRLTDGFRESGSLE